MRPWLRSSRLMVGRAGATWLALLRAGAAVALLMAVVTPAPSTQAQSGLSVPSGFRASVYASGLTTPTAMSFGPDGRLYVAQQNGAIVAVGRGGTSVVASGFATILGLKWYYHALYVSSTGEIARLTPSRGYSSFSTRVIVSGLPTGRHQNDGIVFRGGWMYVGIGSTCNACTESDRRSATIMRFHPNGSHAQIYARGLRNPFGLALQPRTNTLYATDNGRDDFDDSVPDELNRIVQGGNYGWPDCWGRGGGSNCRGTAYPVALFPAHSSADGVVFYSGHAFPTRYRGDAFVAEFGDTVNSLGTGHVVQDVHFSGNRATVSTFATGFSNPLAVTLAHDGSLLVADYGTGIVWRIQG